VILLYPELRDILERLGRLDFWGAPIHVTNREDMARTIEEVVRTAMVLSPLKTGALIVLERETGLDDIVATGTELDAEVSSELLGTIFYSGTPLHDGAVIIRGGRIIAAGCYLPLSDSPNISANVHTRHRAAIGVSENSDAVVVVVSEETGTVSIAVGGKLNRGLNEEKLRAKLAEAFGRTIGMKDVRSAVALPFSRRNGKGTAPGTASRNGNGGATREVVRAAREGAAATKPAGEERRQP
jgi:diadenylate cyclase